MLAMSSILVIQLNLDRLSKSRCAAAAKTGSDGYLDVTNCRESDMNEIMAMWDAASSDDSALGRMCKANKQESAASSAFLAPRSPGFYIPYNKVCPQPDLQYQYTSMDLDLSL